MQFLQAFLVCVLCVCSFLLTESLQQLLPARLINSHATKVIRRGGELPTLPARPTPASRFLLMASAGRGGGATKLDTRTGALTKPY